MFSVLILSIFPSTLSSLIVFVSLRFEVLRLSPSYPLLPVSLSFSHSLSLHHFLSIYLSIIVPSILHLSLFIHLSIYLILVYQSVLYIYIYNVYLIFRRLHLNHIFTTNLFYIDQKKTIRCQLS